MSRESDLWGWLNRPAKKYKGRLHLLRIENLVGSGVPDVEGCLNGNHFWIELKCAAEPKRADTKLKPRFQPRQIPWLKARDRAGGRAYVLLQVGSGHSATRYLLTPTWAEQLKNSGMTKEALAAASLC
jgi:hypothetical protein